MQHLTIVIPCYNEERRISLKEYADFLSQTSTHLLFVDDGSADQTYLVLEGLRQRFPAQVNILRLPVNGGKAEAVRKGILAVRTIDESDIVGFMDADLSIPLQESTYFHDAFADPNIEFSFGSRVCRLGAKITRIHFYRFLFGRLLATAISLYLKVPVYDTQCGAKFFKAGLAKKIFAQSFVSRWLFDVELFKRMALLNINVEEHALELPLHTCIEKKGSKIRIKDCLRLPFDFLSIVRHYRMNNYHKHSSPTTTPTLSQVKVIERETAVTHE